MAAARVSQSSQQCANQKTGRETTNCSVLLFWAAVYGWTPSLSNIRPIKARSRLPCLNQAQPSHTTTTHNHAPV